MSRFYGTKHIKDSRLYQFGLHHFLLGDICNNKTRFQVGKQEELVEDKPIGGITPDLKILFDFWQPLDAYKGSQMRFIVGDDKKTSDFLDIDAFFEQLMYKGDNRSVDWDNVEEVVDKFSTCFGVNAIYFAEMVSGEAQPNGQTETRPEIDFIPAALCVAFQNPAAVWLQLSTPRPTVEGGEEDAYCYVRGVRPRESH